MTLGESFANSDKIKNNSPNKNIPAQAPVVKKQMGWGEGGARGGKDMGTQDDSERAF